MTESIFVFESKIERKAFTQTYSWLFSLLFTFVLCYLILILTQLKSCIQSIVAYSKQRIFFCFWYGIIRSNAKNHKRITWNPQSILACVCISLPLIFKTNKQICTSMYLIRKLWKISRILLILILFSNSPDHCLPLTQLISVLKFFVVLYIVDLERRETKFNR